MGEVTATKTGLRYGRVATLYEVRVAGLNSRAKAADNVSFFLTHGQIELLGHPICAAFRRPHEAPMRGDRVLVLLPSGDAVAGGPRMIDESRIFWEDETDALHAPLAVEGHFVGRSINDVVEELRSDVAASKGGAR